MSLRISPIMYSKVYYSNKKMNNPLKNEVPAAETAPVNFEAVKIKSPKNLVVHTESLVRPSVAQEGVAKNLFEKFARYYTEILTGNASISKPVLVKDGDSFIGFTIDKTDPNRVKVVIKDALKSAEDWKTLGRTQTILEAIFNKDGVMAEAEYIYSKFIETRIGNTPMMMIGCHYNFERTGRNTRHIISDNTKFRAVPACKYIWQSVSTETDRKIDLMNQGISESEAINTFFREYIQRYSAVTGK